MNSRHILCGEGGVKLLGKANELQVVHLHGLYLETAINENLKRLGNVEVLDIKFHDGKVLIIYKKN